MSSDSFSIAVGDYLKTCRAEHGLTLDQVARAGRMFGARWNASSVKAIEVGRASTTIQTLLVLALAIGELTGQPVRLAELFSTGSDFSPPSFGARAPISREWLAEVLAGSPVQVTRDIDWRDELRHEYTPWSEASARILLNEELDRQVLENMGRPPSDAEKDAHFDALLDEYRDPERVSEASDRQVRPSLPVARAAKKLGIGPIEVERWAQKLWAKAYERESRDRAGDTSSPQARGRVNRILVEEIRKAMGGS